MNWARILQAALVALCAGVAVGFVRQAGGTGSFEPQVEYVAIILAAVWFGPWAGALVAMLCGLLVGPLMPSNVGNGTPQEIGVWLPRLVYFVAIGTAFGLMQQRLRRHLGDLERTRDDLKKRNADLAEADALLEIGALSHLDAAVLAGQGEQGVLETIAEIVCTAMGAQLGLVVYLDPASNMLTVKAQSGLHGESATKIKLVIGHLRIGKGLPWRAIVERQPVSSGNLSSEEDNGRASEVAEMGAVGMAAPLGPGNEPFGAICAIWRQQRQFDRSDLERMGRLAGQASLAIQKAGEHRIIEEVTFDIIVALAEAIESRASYTAGHVARIVEYAELIAESLHLPEAEVRSIRYGAVLHDVGMVSVPDEVIRKPSHLTHEELEQVRLHPYFGGQLCKRAGFLAPLIPIIYHHHERFDGKGYPDGLRGPAIPLGARIVAVADAYDGMTTKRPYRPALSEEEAAEALRREAGQQLDPDLVNTLIEALEERQRHSLKAA